MQIYRYKIQKKMTLIIKKTFRENFPKSLQVLNKL